MNLHRPDKPGPLAACQDHKDFADLRRIGMDASARLRDCPAVELDIFRQRKGIADNRAARDFRVVYDLTPSVKLVLNIEFFS
jgi:hypothetical protein